MEDVLEEIVGEIEDEFSLAVDDRRLLDPTRMDAVLDRERRSDAQRKTSGPHVRRPAIDERRFRYHGGFRLYRATWQNVPHCRRCGLKTDDVARSRWCQVSGRSIQQLRLTLKISNENGAPTENSGKRRDVILPAGFLSCLTCGQSTPPLSYRGRWSYRPVSAHRTPDQDVPWSRWLPVSRFSSSSGHAPPSVSGHPRTGRLALTRCQ